MSDSIKTCVVGDCQDCDISSKTNCFYSPCQLLEFYLISLPAFIIGGIGLYNFSPLSLYIWLAIAVLFFFVIEIRVLCSHCPHYENSKGVLMCWANSGAPKLWRFRPWPMNALEKTLLLGGFALIWGYPLVVFLVIQEWMFLLAGLVLSTSFFLILKKRNCVKCINLSCPLNNLDKNSKRVFLRNNPVFRENMKE